jgi:GGDEF domain-containing protein
LKLSLAVTALADADGAMVAADTEKTLARALAQAVRRTDTAYHLRPGHFHVVLTHTDAQGAALALQRLTGRLDALQLGVHMRTAAVEAPPRTESPDYVALAQTLLADVDARLTLT